MENVAQWVSSNPFTSVGIAAFVCGIALLFLVMRRTMKHREKTTQIQE